MKWMARRKYVLTIVCAVFTAGCSGSDSDSTKNTEETCEPPIRVSVSEQATWTIESKGETSSLTLEVPEQGKIVLDKGESDDQAEFIETGDCPPYETDDELTSIERYVVFSRLPSHGLIIDYFGFEPPKEGTPPPVTPTPTCDDAAEGSDRVCYGELEYDGEIYEWEETRDVHEPYPGGGLISFTLRLGDEVLYHVELVGWNGL